MGQMAHKWVKWPLSGIIWYYLVLSGIIWYFMVQFKTQTANKSKNRYTRPQGNHKHYTREGNT